MASRRRTASPSSESVECENSEFTGSEALSETILSPNVMVEEHIASTEGTDLSEASYIPPVKPKQKSASAVSGKKKLKTKHSQPKKKGPIKDKGRNGRKAKPQSKNPRSNIGQPIAEIHLDSLEKIDIDMVKLIYAIEIRGTIWDSTHPLHSDLVSTRRCWEEIAKEQIPNFDNYVSSDREVLLQELKKRWRSVRDRFKKIMEKEENLPSGSSACVSSNYKYLEQLQFLRKRFRKRKTTSYVQSEATPAFDNDPNTFPLEEPEEVPGCTIPGSVHPNPVGSAPFSAAPPRFIRPLRQAKASLGPSNRRSRNTDDREELFNALHQLQEQMEQDRLQEKEERRHLENRFFDELGDPDALFCRMLIPYFKQMPLQQRLLAKIAVMGVVSEFLVKNTSGHMAGGIDPVPFPPCPIVPESSLATTVGEALGQVNTQQYAEPLHQGLLHQGEPSQVDPFVYQHL